MPNTAYDNFYLSNEIEDQFKSHLDLMRFCTIDNNLEGTPGMTRKVHVYKATDGTQKVTKGVGNTKDIEVSFEEKEYTILTAQNRFSYYDEEAMNDPMLVPTGTKHAAIDIFNTVNADVFAEFNKASLQVTPTALNFDAFVDAVAKLNFEDEGSDKDKPEIFGFVNAADTASLRKALKEDLKYVEAFARSGYIGTVAGVNIYTKKDAVTGTVVIGTKDAVTVFNKKGTEVEQSRDSNLRKNSVYSRKYYVAALTDETKAVKIVVSPA